MRVIKHRASRFVKILRKQVPKRLHGASSRVDSFVRGFVGFHEDTEGYEEDVEVCNVWRTTKRKRSGRLLASSFSSLSSWYVRTKLRNAGAKQQALVAMPLWGPRGLDRSRVTHREAANANARWPRVRTRRRRVARATARSLTHLARTRPRWSRLPGRSLTSRRSRRRYTTFSLLYTTKSYRKYVTCETAIRDGPYASRLSRTRATSLCNRPSVRHERENAKQKNSTKKKIKITETINNKKKHRAKIEKEEQQTIQKGRIMKTREGERKEKKTKYGEIRSRSSPGSRWRHTTIHITPRATCRHQSKKSTKEDPATCQIIPLILYYIIYKTPKQMCTFDAYKKLIKSSSPSSDFFTALLRYEKIV